MVQKSSETIRRRQPFAKLRINCFHIRNRNNTKTTMLLFVLILFFQPAIRNNQLNKYYIGKLQI
jgi:hypothetical protein